MKYCLPSVVFRSLLGVLLLSALGSCTLYHKVFHPYRLPTPKPSPEFIAQQKEKKEHEKLQNDLAKSAASAKKKAGADAPEAATDVSTPSNDGATASASTAAAKSSVYPERSTVRYDKHGLMKKPKLNRRKRHKVSKGFHPIESIRNFFKYGFHAKPNYSPDHRPAPKQPSTTPEQELPDEAMPAPKPEPAAEPAPSPAPGGKP
ncbi:hypothetical protein [Hymenobacter negativus]|uniref:Uncharacterized protein n=1 Tax=Hymenobacter negativus TaxID=2795026 RepID=A0ABS0QAM8_9BACT|nr:hypothetical protein [Hymenobacter negativus]MBH8559741.1 hypothetical protein [Hymenobacter negativus]